MSAGFAGRHVVGLGYLSVDVFLQVQNEHYTQTLYLIDYIAYGLHIWYRFQISKEISRSRSKPWFTNKCTGSCTCAHTLFEIC
jgi:hypothetical protein